MISKFLTVSLGLLIATSSMASCNHRYGVMKCGSEVVQSIQSNGYTELNGTTVKGDTYVNGSLSAANAFLNKVLINGSAIFSDTNIDGKVEINGTLTAKKSTFSKDIILASNESTFSKSIIKNIDVKASLPPGNQKIYLKNKTTAASIKFESGNGIVYISGGSTINSVVGGRLIKN